MSGADALPPDAAGAGDGTPPPDAVTSVAAEDPTSAPPPRPREGGVESLLHGVPLRLWAELGRASIPVGRAVALGSGAVVELDRAVEDPVDLYVNGRRFATGSLLVSAGGEWAVRIDELVDDAARAPGDAPPA